MYSIFTTNILIFCCKKRSPCKISPLPSELLRMSFVRANIFHPQWMIISRLGVGVEFSVASNKNWFQWIFLRIFYHMVNDSILEIDSNSSNYSIPVDFTGKPEENLFLSHQSGTSHCLTRSWRKKVFFSFKVRPKQPKFIWLVNCFQVKQIYTRRVAGTSLPCVSSDVPQNSSVIDSICRMMGIMAASELVFTLCKIKLRFS